MCINVHYTAKKDYIVELHKLQVLLLLLQLNLAEL